MAEKTEIIIIAPEFLMDLAKDAVEEISGIPGFKAVSFEVGYFLKKPLQQRLSRFFISLGDTSENGYTNQVLPCMLESYNHDGACISYNATHAIIFGETDHGVTDTLKRIPGETLESINTLKKRILSKLKGTDKVGPADPLDDVTPTQKKSESMDYQNSWSRIKKTVMTGVVGGPLGLPFTSLAMKTASQRDTFRKENTQIALKRFLADFFKNWARNIKEG